MGPTRRALVKAVAGHLAMLALLGRNGISLSASSRRPRFFNSHKHFPRIMSLQLARERAKQPYVEAKVAMPENWQSLTFDQYRDIRFDINKSIWRGAPHGFSIDLLHTGFFYSSPVDIYVVAGGQQMRTQLSARSLHLRAPGAQAARAISISIIRASACATRSTGKDYFDEFAVFQGASYFRAIGKGQIYGLSARGLADRYRPAARRGVSVLPRLLDRGAAGRRGHRPSSMRCSIQPSATGAYPLQHQARRNRPKWMSRLRSSRAAISSMPASHRSPACICSMNSVHRQLSTIIARPSMILTD